MMCHLNIIFAVLCVLALHVSAASQISLTADPSDIKDGLTDTLALTCSIQNTTTSNTDSDALQRLGVSSTSFDIEHVNSVIVFRDNSDKAGIPIARIIASKSVEKLTQEENLQVQGVLDPVSSNPKVLELVWTKPRKEQEGQYKCEIYALDPIGRSVVLEAKVNVEIKRPGIRELITEMINLEIKHDEDIKNLKTQTGNLTSTVSQMKSVLKPPHTEYGIVSCPTTNTFVRFRESYTTTPVVSLGINHFYASHDNSRRTGIFAYVNSVNTSGFSVSCGRYINSNTVVHSMRVRWTSMVA